MTVRRVYLELFPGYYFTGDGGILTRMATCSSWAGSTT